MSSFVSCTNGYFTFARAVSETELCDFVASLLEQRASIYHNLIMDRHKLVLLISLHIGIYQKEVFACLFFNEKKQFIAFEKMFFGSRYGAEISIADIVKEALSKQSFYVIVAHNHPSGMVEPSEVDKHTTLKIKHSLAVFDIELVDHIIVNAQGESFSFEQANLLEPYQLDSLSNMLAQA